MMKEKPCIIITGPTASGKSDFAEKLALQCDSFIINADMGQCYTPLTVGTAKPDLNNVPVPCYLFDILDKPVDFSVMAYRKHVLELMSKSQTPVIVGGSLFYLKSLFFSPQEHPEVEQKAPPIDVTLSTTQLWEKLFTIDPVRAKALYKEDRYRIVRALMIWQKTGLLPSTLSPLFDPPKQPVIIVALLPNRSVLQERVIARTHMMFDAWIQEARSLYQTEWQEFIVKKGLIGYSDIFDWFDRGTPEKERNHIIDTIIIKTMQYAKRQVTFFKSFEKQVYDAYQGAPYSCVIKKYEIGNEIALQEIKEIVCPKI
jgi:tRNA dimethylallyltransferase